MNVDIFRQVRESVTAEQAATAYGLEVRQHKALCPYHSDHSPSLSFHAGRFRCWACGAHGDAVDLTARLLNLDAVGALRRLNADFSLALPLDRPPTAQERRQAAQAEHNRDISRRFEEWRNETLNALCAAIREGNAALNGIETPNDLDALTARQVEAVKILPWLEHIEEQLAHGTEAEQLEVFAMRKEVQQLCNFLTQRRESSKTA